jgi:hypothetical protein
VGADDDSGIIAFIPLKIQDVYDARIPRWLRSIGRSRRSVERVRDGEHDDEGDDELRIDLGRAGQSEMVLGDMDKV